MAYIGFLLIMAGLAAAGGASDRGTGFLTAIMMVAEGAALMWLFMETDEDGGENGDGPVSGGSLVDRPASESTEGSGGNKSAGRLDDGWIYL